MWKQGTSVRRSIADLRSYCRDLVLLVVLVVGCRLSSLMIPPPDADVVCAVDAILTVIDTA